MMSILLFIFKLKTKMGPLLGVKPIQYLQIVASYNLLISNSNSSKFECTFDMIETSTIQHGSPFGFPVKNNCRS